GEFAAAYCAGVYTLEQALELLIERARLMQALPRNGVMAAVFADVATVTEETEQCGRWYVAMAAHNAPQRLVISADRDVVGALMARFEDVGIRCERLTVSHAFHSP